MQNNLTSLKEYSLKMLESWKETVNCAHTTEELLAWIATLNQRTKVEVTPTSLSSDSFWFYDDYKGEILNRKRSFFSIVGLRYFRNEEFVSEQPIILQPEIGYLGLLVKEINGVLHFLMQAKIEPGNVNFVQLSPTIQATKSNFTRAHGGRLPYYFDLFEKAEENGTVLYDQIQSEQGSRFLAKRNRNIILLPDREIEVYPEYRWMTLGQIKECMSVPNLVNMDTRTVLSGIPFAGFELNNQERKKAESFFTDKALYRSLYETNPQDTLSPAMTRLNDYKMFTEVEQNVVPLRQLMDWKVDDYGVHCKKPAPFSVEYYEVQISGREVQQWLQPLVKAQSESVFVLVTTVTEGIRKFLIRVEPEIGCFDKAEFGPSLRLEPNGQSSCPSESEKDEESLGAEEALLQLVQNHLKEHQGILKDVVLSEEGGRFYREQNRNVILEIKPEEMSKLPKGTVWMDFSALNLLVQSNNLLNIQLRNLLSLLDL